MFVDAPLEEVNEVAHECRLDFVQLHGSESPEYCRKVKYPIIKAFRVEDTFIAADADQYKADYILCDSFVPGYSGGTGITFDWKKASNSLQLIKTPVLVAGGLTMENVTNAVSILKPAGVDVSGGVETGGLKDAEKIRQFIRAARAAQGGDGNA